MQSVVTEKDHPQSVFCNGKDALLDHPHIYLKVDPELGYIHCPYCNKKFTL